MTIISGIINSRKNKTVDIGSIVTQKNQRILNYISKYNERLDPVFISKSDYELLNEYENRVYNLDDGSIFDGSTKTQDYNYDFGVGDVLVSTTGDDVTGDGSELNPFATWEYAITQLPSIGGVNIWIEGGSYVMDNGSGRAVVSVDFENEVIIKAKPNETVNLTHVSNTSGVFFNDPCNNITFEGLTFNPISSTIYFFYVASSGNIKNISIRDCAINDGVNQQYALRFLQSGDNYNNSVKRCNITSALNKNYVSYRNSTGENYYIGNTYTSTYANPQCYEMGTGCSGTLYCNNNTIVANTILDATSNTLFDLRTNLSHDVSIVFNRNNIDAKVATTLIRSTTVGFFVTLTMKGNYINSPEINNVFGSVYSISGGEIMYNEIIADSVPLGMPVEQVLIVGQEVSNLEIAYNKFSSLDHTLLFGENSLNHNLHDNICVGSTGLFGAVIKGGGHAIDKNVISGGTRNALYLKNAENCICDSNVLTQDVSGGNAIEYGTGNGFDSRNNTIKNCIAKATNGGNIIDSGDIGTGNTQNNNYFKVVSGGLWGNLFGSITSFQELKYSWLDNYPSNPNNDEDSIEAI